jgi:amidophosphoribosyltransferase
VYKFYLHKGSRNDKLGYPSKIGICFMCGVIGIIGSSRSYHEALEGLLLLQHRGQDSAGILVTDKNHQRFLVHRSLGKVADLVAKHRGEVNSGMISLGHTRYSTIGAVKEEDLQPLLFSHPVGLALVQNGNLSNYQKLRAELSLQQRSFSTDNDLEVILHLMAPYLIPEKWQHGSPSALFEALVCAVGEVFQRAEGGYALVGTVAHSGLFGLRDPYGLRPLVMGQKVGLSGEIIIGFASESGALEHLDFKNTRDVKPGELVWVDLDGQICTHQFPVPTPRPCVFEWIYFSSADSVSADKGVYDVRVRLGQLLGQRIRSEYSPGAELPFDVVVPVPDTSRAAAVGVAEALGLPYREGLLKSRYVQRSFIENNQEQRKSVVERKFSVVKSLVAGKRILLVDDSVVRGTTSKKIVQLLRSREAQAVSLASTCPPVRHPCYYGIDFSTYHELFAHRLGNLAAMKQELGVDHLFFTQIEDLSQSLETTNFCRACLDGNYAYPPPIK